MKEISLIELKDVITSKLQKIIPSKLKEIIPSKFHKWLLPGLALILVIILACCFLGSEPADEAVTVTVSADEINVHKKPDFGSKVLSQLPRGLEIEILEQKTVDEAEWGRVDQITLPDGTKAQGGWINLEYVRFPGEPEIVPTETEPVIETEPEPVGVTATMGTVTTGKLNIRKGAGSQYEAFDSYLRGDRIEIQEVIVVDDTEWGFTGKGWVGMGYVRMDGTAPSGENSNTNNKIISDGSLLILGYGVVDLGTLNVRSGPGTHHEKVGTVSEGVRYAYYQTESDWVRIEDGWVSTEFFYTEGSTAGDRTSGVVTTDDLNYRTGPSTSFKSNGTLKTGDAVEILAQVNGWGYTTDGWINMTHVKITYSTGTGTVTSGLNIRQEPNSGSKKIDSYKEGDRVTILEVSEDWGRTDKGWIYLKYVKYD